MTLKTEGSSVTCWQADVFHSALETPDTHHTWTTHITRCLFGVNTRLFFYLLCSHMHRYSFYGHLHHKLSHQTRTPSFPPPLFLSLHSCLLTAQTLFTANQPTNQHTSEPKPTPSPLLPPETIKKNHNALHPVIVLSACIYFFFPVGPWLFSWLFGLCTCIEPKINLNLPCSIACKQMDKHEQN